MSHFRFVLAGCLLSALAVTSPMMAISTQDQDVRNKLSGRWVCHLEPELTWILSIDGTDVSLAIEADQKRAEAWAGRLKFSSSDPDKHFDWTDRRSVAGIWPDEKCLYRCTGDTLLIIRSKDDRPTRFLSGEGFAPKTLVFTRLETDTRRE